MLDKDLVAIVNANAIQTFLDFKEGILNNPGNENAFNTFEKIVAQAIKWENQTKEGKKHAQKCKLASSVSAVGVAEETYDDNTDS